MNLTKEQQAELRTKLIEEKHRIELQLQEEKKQLDFGNDVDGFEEETDEAEEYANYLGVESVEKEALHDIVTALDKIIDGTYGICEKCAGEISYELLSLQPESKLCKACKLAEQ